MIVMSSVRARPSLPSPPSLAAASYWQLYQPP